MASSHPHATPELIYTPPLTSEPAQSPSGSANISIREYIYFLPHPLPSGTPVPYTPGLPSTNPLNLAAQPFEPTSTLVLTSPGRTFIDLRYLKPIGKNESELPNAGESKRLEWGFAGSSSSSPSPNSPHKKFGEFGHSTWEHWLDSRVKVGEQIPVDEGDMYDLGEGLFLEHGHAFHPHLGRVAGHEELWRDVPVLSTSTDNQEGKKGKVCIVLRCEDKEEGIRGVVIRVGQFCQGILMHGEVVTTERWEFKGDENIGEETDGKADVPQEKGWRRTARTGDAFLPCSVAFRMDVVKLGGSVRYGGFEWRVEEVWVWN